MPRAPNASNTRVVHDVAYSATRFSNRGCTARAGLARVAAHATQVLPVGWWSYIVLSGKTVGIIGGGGRI